MSTTAVTADTFMETIEGHDIVLVDFWAAWCGPCRQFAPVFEQAAAQHPDVVFAKVDTEAEPGLSTQAGISSIPTLMVFRDKVMVYNEPGARPARALEQIIQAVKGLDMDDVRRQIDAQGTTQEDEHRSEHAKH